MCNARSSPSIFVMRLLALLLSLGAHRNSHNSEIPAGPEIKPLSSSLASCVRMHGMHMCVCRLPWSMGAHRQVWVQNVSSLWCMIDRAVAVSQKTDHIFSYWFLLEQKLCYSESDSWWCLLYWLMLLCLEASPTMLATDALITNYDMLLPLFIVIRLFRTNAF
jgi:hypothetical protein